MSSAPPFPLTLPDTPITSWRKESKLWNTTRGLTLLTSPTAPLTTALMFNFDSCSFSTPCITSSINLWENPAPHPLATNLFSNEVIHPAATVAPLMAVTSIEPIAMDALITTAPTVIGDDLAPGAPTNSPIHPAGMVQRTGMELTAMDPTTTTDTPAAQIEVQAGEDEPVATEQGVVRNSEGGEKGIEQRHPQMTPIQPSALSVNVPLWKTGQVHQESTCMAQANMIGKSAKRLRTGEAEHAIQKKKHKSGV
ncbi:hypothetical protein BDR04DRAFT_1156408 [Suillus decipiens]|nr:hypothetical protein BDR04DRAFT_1156408 [Suillus decipiens]